MATQTLSLAEERSSVRYIAPFFAFLLLLAAGQVIPLENAWGGPLRVLALGVICTVCWPREISFRPKFPVTSVIIGALVFVLWIAPDLLVPGYRQSVLFSNSLTGHLHASFESSALHNPWILAWRSARAVVIVPIVEELFWRAWLMRWLIDKHFWRVPLGTYAPFAFWITAILFASEHGPYWDVGLVTGVIFNFWMIRSKSIADCVLMHAVTNAMLSAYVIQTAQWQYWQ
ncbi:MAG TPA: CAAX prenyl protease-related protein [Bryobacteraceae bacterium]